MAFGTGVEDGVVITGSVATNDSDVDDGAVLTFTLASPVAGLTFNPDGTFSYVTDTVLIVHGRDEPFAHRDENTLRKVGEPKPNPWAAILAKRAAHTAP